MPRLHVFMPEVLQEGDIFLKDKETCSERVCDVRTSHPWLRQMAL